MSRWLPKRLAQSEWLSHLASKTDRLTVSLEGAPGRFRTPPGWDTDRRAGLPEHLVYYFAQGSARAELIGQSFTCSPGSCCWVTPGTPFRFFSNKTPLVWRFRFAVTSGRKETTLAPHRRFYFLAAAPTLSAIVDSLLEESVHPERWRQEALRAWLIQFSILFFRGAEPERKHLLTHAQRQAIADCIAGAPTGAFLTVRDLARASGLTLDYFSRVFRRTHGLAPRRWLVRQRLAQAAVLLQETTLRVGTIAEQLGYENIELFSRQFTIRYGQSPRAFRHGHSA